MHASLLATELSQSPIFEKIPAVLDDFLESKEPRRTRLDACMHRYGNSDFIYVFAEGNVLIFLESLRAPYIKDLWTLSSFFCY